MKVDDLIDRDNMVIDVNEWTAYLELGPLRGSAQMTLAEGYALSSGSVYLRYQYTAPMDHTFIGYRVMRVWHAPDGTLVVRTVRSDVWTPAFVALKGAKIEVEVVINPEDWA